MGLYQHFLRSVALPAGSYAAGYRDVMPYLRGLESSQWWSQDQLRELQNRKLRHLIAHVYEHVPYYHDLMQQTGLRPADIQTTDDLVKLPIVDKHVLTGNYPDRIRDHSIPDGELIAAGSSGSTGERLLYWTTKPQKARKWAGLFRFWEMAGYHFGDRYATFTVSANRGLRNSALLLQLEWGLLRHLWMPMVEITDENLETYTRKLDAFRPVMLRSYASTAYYLALYMVRHGANVPIPAIITTGETLSPHMRDVIEQAFAPGRVFVEYGGDGMQFAGECDRHQGYHLNDETTFLEVVRDGQRLPDGELGELVFTNLEATAVPFIRYNIHDVGILTHEPCACGRGLPRLTHLEGRLTDLFVTRDGHWISVHHFTGLFGHMPSVYAFQVIQRQPDDVLIKLVVNEAFSDQDEQTILKTFSRYLGAGAQVELEFVDAIPTTPSGKRRFFISQAIQEAGPLLPLLAEQTQPAVPPLEQP